MDLLAITTGAINVVTPYVPATYQASTGYTSGAAGNAYKRQPVYAAPVTVSVQVQALSSRDLRQIEGLNLNGTVRAIYFDGTMNATVRTSLKGGDLITLSDGPNVGVWLVNQVLEQWEDWVKVVATLQNGS